MTLRATSSVSKQNDKDAQGNECMLTELTESEHLQIYCAPRCLSHTMQCSNIYKVVLGRCNIGATYCTSTLLLRQTARGVGAEPAVTVVHAAQL